jgi:hypothetical protein
MMLSNFSKHHFSLLFAFVYLKTVLHAQVLQLGSCPNPSVMSNFDIDQVSSTEQLILSSHNWLMFFINISPVLKNFDLFDGVQFHSSFPERGITTEITFLLLKLG